MDNFPILKIGQKITFTDRFHHWFGYSIPNVGTIMWFDSDGRVAVKTDNGLYLVERGYITNEG